MKRLLLLCLSSFTVSLPALAQNDAEPWEMLETYCMDCHNYEDFSGGVAFDLMSPDSLHQDAEVWEKSLRKLRGRLMPPPGSDQPEQSTINEFMTWLEGNLDESEIAPIAGHVPLQRLNRTEYAIAVKDLLGVEVNPEDILPAEIEVDGFSNIAAALSTSPSFLDQYISAARSTASLAIGQPVAKVSSVYFESPGGDQGDFVDGLPLGTRGGMKVSYPFPADGEYRFNILDLDVGLYPRAAETLHTLVLIVDGEEVFRGDVGGEDDIELVDRYGAAGREELMARFANIPALVRAGRHDVVVTFIERSRAESDWNVGSSSGFGGIRVPRILGGFEIVGPYNSTGVSMTPSRKKIFICTPNSSVDEKACARDIAENLARRAYRRNVTDLDIDLLMPFFEAGRQGLGGFDEGIEQVVAAVLSSADFLYRGISPIKDIAKAGTFELNNIELATRLSFFLWSQGPDSQLLESANKGELSNPAVMEAQVKRMLADPKAESIINNFAMNWLNLDELEAIEPEPRQFPGFSDELRESFSEEVTLFLKSVLLEDRPVIELLTASHTYLNQNLANYYGIDSVFGPQFRKVELEDENRWGLLGKSAVLLRTSYGDRTSPVLRGAWVLERILGTPPTPPPPNVETDLSVPEGGAPTTVRARLEKHRDNPTCRQCHGVIDPIGLALENYSVTGQWREIDEQADAVIDASTVMPNGVAINGPIELRLELAKKPSQFAMTLTEKLMMYGLARELEYFDMPQVRAIVRAAEEQEYRLSALVLGIVNSKAFRLQALPHSSETIAVNH